jgi:uncharacterized protein (TIGR02647 family)
MHLSPELSSELDILASYNLDTTMEGIKVHKDADPRIIEAVARLYEKRMVTQADGGYLTELGRSTAEHVQEAVRILSST